MKTEKRPKDVFSQQKIITASLKSEQFTKKQNNIILYRVIFINSYIILYRVIFINSYIILSYIYQLLMSTEYCIYLYEYIKFNYNIL